MEDKGLRFNEGKLRYDLLHPVAQKGIVKVLTKGAEKYAPHNWEKGMEWSKVIASLKRHLADFENGIDFDQETGELHIDHIQCNAHFLSSYYKIAPQYDDRNHNYLNEARIGLDIDEVLADWVGAWCQLHNIKERPNNWYFFKDILKEFNEMKDKDVLDDFYLKLKVKTKPSDIHFEPDCYITSRPVSTEISEKWLYDNGFPVRPVFTTTPNKSKLHYAKQRNLDIFIDDGWSNFHQLNKNGVLCYLFDAPHNQRYNVGYKRIKQISDLK